MKEKVMKTINFAHDDYTPKQSPYAKTCFLGLIGVTVITFTLIHRLNNYRLIQINKEISSLQAKMAARRSSHKPDLKNKNTIRACVIEFLFNLSSKHTIHVERLQISPNKHELTCSSNKASNLVSLNNTILKHSHVKSCRLENLCKKNNHYSARFTLS
ncbi:hypothetical protein Noda2021_12300 [Candidatus Dependentiae bacterium Noda2021]|nr:hypothetical protein Noda2021_12300 [Candidatus Dependentiae bacterium Noda2021]